MIIFRFLICTIIAILAFAISCAAAFVSAGVAADVSEQFKSLQCFGGLGLMFGLLYVFAPGSLLAFVLGGLRFRGWAVEGRSGIPRFSRHTETVVLWLAYSGAIGFVTFWVRQVLHDLR